MKKFVAVMMVLLTVVSSFGNSQASSSQTANFEEWVVRHDVRAEAE